MSITPDPITCRKLVLVKLLYQNALLQATSQNMAQKMFAVIGFDLTSETAVKALIGALETQKPPEYKFGDLMKQADSLLREKGMPPVPDQACVLHVHSLRNDAQHKGKYPSGTDVSDCRTYTRDFLAKLYQNVWSIDFEKVSLSDLIENVGARRFVHAAESALTDHDFEKALIFAVSGLYYALDRVSDAVYTRSDTVELRSFDAAAESVLAIALGLNVERYLRLRRITGVVTRLADDDVSCEGLIMPVSSEDAEFAVAFCTEAVVEIESRVGALDEF